MIEMRTLIAFAATILIAGCSSEPGDLQTPSRLADAMQGFHESAPGDPDNDFTDQRFRLDFAGQDDGAAWVYMQLNTGPDRKVYRQRVLHLLPGPDGVSQNAWILKDPSKVLDDKGQPSNVAALTQDDLEEPLLEDGCEQLWRYSPQTQIQPWEWVGIVDPETCVIESKRRNKRIGIGSQARLTATTLKQAERGFDLDGTQLWGTQPGEFTVLYRQQ